MGKVKRKVVRQKIEEVYVSIPNGKGKAGYSGEELRIAAFVSIPNGKGKGLLKLCRRRNRLKGINSQWER